MNYEVKLILEKLKIVSEEQERGFYLCDKEHSKLLLDYITNLQEEIKEKNEDLDLMKKIAFHWENYSEILSTRNEKAIEYNDKNIHSQTLNNILQGSDKE